MVHGNLTADNAVNPLVSQLVISIPLTIGVLFLIFFVWNTFEKEIYQYLVSNHCCLWMLPAKIHPDGTVGKIGVRLPTSAERVIALGKLAQAPRGTTIKEIQDELVKGPPNNGSDSTLILPIEPEWKRTSKREVAYTIEEGIVSTDLHEV